MAYKWCVVPQCTNTSIKTPQKQFVSVPTDPKRRKNWLQLAGRDPKSIGPLSNVFMCEDHLDMERDTINYMQYKMGFAQKILLAKKAEPSKFNCQENRKRQLHDADFSGKVFEKRQSKKYEEGSRRHRQKSIITSKNGCVNTAVETNVTEPLDVKPSNSLSTLEPSTSRSTSPTIKIEIDEDKWCEGISSLGGVHTDVETNTMDPLDINSSIPAPKLELSPPRSTTPPIKIEIGENKWYEESTNLAEAEGQRNPLICEKIEVVEKKRCVYCDKAMETPRHKKLGVLLRKASGLAKNRLKNLRATRQALTKIAKQNTQLANVIAELKANIANEHADILSTIDNANQDLRNIRGARQALTRLTKKNARLMDVITELNLRLVMKT